MDMGLVKNSTEMSNRLSMVYQKIVMAIEECGRQQDAVTLVAVSKGHSSLEIREAYACGVRDFGESYVQEWQVKYQELSDLSDLRWHFIGHLQSNKVKSVFGKAYCIHSLDRASLLASFEKQSIEGATKKQRVLIQVEVDPSDRNKSGVPNDSLVSFAKQVSASSNLQLDGFMGMGPADATEKKLASLFSSFVDSANFAWKSLELKGAPIISLGMSDDLRPAIAAGSTLVRVGTAIFGPRIYKQ